MDWTAHLLRSTRARERRRRSTALRVLGLQLLAVLVKLRLREKAPPGPTDSAASVVVSRLVEERLERERGVERWEREIKSEGEKRVREKERESVRER